VAGGRGDVSRGDASDEARGYEPAGLNAMEVIVKPSHRKTISLRDNPVYRVEEAGQEPGS